MSEKEGESDEIKKDGFFVRIKKSFRIGEKKTGEKNSAVGLISGKSDTSQKSNLKFVNLIPASRLKKQPQGKPKSEDNESEEVPQLVNASDAVSTSSSHKEPQENRLDVGGSRMSSKVFGDDIKQASNIFSPANMFGPEVVITGISGRFPESNNIDEFRENLFAGKDMVTEDDRRWPPGLFGLPNRNGKLKDISRFDASFFGVHPKQADVMDPQLRHLLELTYEAIVDAGMNPQELRGTKTGVFIGQTFSEAQEYFAQDPDTFTGYSLTGTSRAMIANRVSYVFDFKGPSYCLDTACSSALFALQQAVTAIQRGDCDAAVVGGVNLLIKAHTSLQFQRLSMLSPRGTCRAFDSTGDGYVRSETTSVLFLQKTKDARRIYSTIVKTKTNTDGFKEQGITYPAGAMQKRLIEDVFDGIPVKPEQVSYVEAHGTGTKVGDPEEVNTIDEFFCKNRKEPLLLGSVKSNMGHAEAAAGMSSLAKVIIAMETGIIPGNLYFEQPNTNIPGLKEGRLKVVDKNTKWDGDYVAINSFGFGGANAHVLLKSHKRSKVCSRTRKNAVIVGVSGRTQEAVEHFLNSIIPHSMDDEFIALIHDINKINIPGHSYRGYMVLEDEPYKEISELKNQDGRELWYVFSGMGSQWTGMGKGLMTLPPFAKAINKCAAALQVEGVDLMQIINSSQPDTFDNILNSFIAIAAVQIGLVDVLKALGLTPDGIVGHSVGELGCAYADGAFTAEQTILAAYWRGKSISESNLKPGCMAAIGLSWEEVNKRLPEGIVAACHNSEDNVTISAPAELLEPFLEELSAQGIFNRKVNSSGFAFHSKYIAEAGPQLRANLEKIIPIPKTRTKRWISTSIPESAWSSELAISSSASYHVNNLLSPVLFHEGLSHIPDGAVVIEIAPHSLLQAVIKRSLPNCSVIGLVKKNVADDVCNFLRNLGKIHNEGIALDLKSLYPKIAYPVGRGTPMISPMLKWDHSIEWQVPLFAKQTSKSGECVIEIDINKESDSFIVGHTIDGRILFPATGYLTLVWKTFAKIQGTQMEETPVILENVQFHRATIMPKEGSVKFAISIFDGSGQFELCESGSTVVSGTIRPMDDFHGLVLKTSSSEPLVQLASEDVYKELRLRGYEYGGVFKGIKKSDINGTIGELSWVGNWISFMDTMLQFSLVGRSSRELALPTRILQVAIDPTKHLQCAENRADIPVQYEKNIDVIQSGGIEIRNLKVSLAPRRQQTQAPPKLEKYVFLPYVKEGIKKEDGLVAALQIVMENSGGALKLKIMELGGEESEEPLAPLISEILSSEPQITAEISFVTLRPENYANLEDYNVNVVKKNYIEAVDSNLHLLVCKSALSYNGLPSVMNSLKSGAFLLMEDRQENNYGSMVVISKYNSDGKGLLLLRKPTEYVLPKVIKITNHDYSWVETVKKGLKDCENGTKVLLVSQGESTSGIVGMINCLKQEPGGSNLRCVFTQDPKAKEFSITSTPYILQLKKDLLQNVLGPNGEWGSFRHLRILNQEDTTTQTEHAFVNAVTRGDLSSLKWIQAPASPIRKETNGVGLCTVYYAPLNFRDIMLASGKLPPDALPGDLAGQECVLGLEFAGRNSRGERVMGIVEAKGLAMSVTCDPLFTWPVPESWTLQQAATVPIVFATAYYSLIVRGGMKPGESVLIHAGTGGVGQAAIQIALYMGCKVFTTVGTQQKREFIKTNFPKLNDRCIGNSRDTSFEQLILSETSGRGVDLVLNSLAEDKLQASVRCLAQGGRFLEIGKLDLSNNSPLGMSILLKNTTVHGILLDALMGKGSENLEKIEVAKLMREGIQSGAVKPLPQTTFNRDQLEQSFRFMASGKHIGKVLLKIRDEEPNKKLLPKKEIINAIPRTYMKLDKSYVLVGGLGGFGLELANWLVTRGATKIVLVSRSGVTNGFQTLCIKRWEQKGVKVLVSKTDCTTPEGAKKLIKEAEALGPVGGIFNLAAVLRDAFMENQSEEDFRAVCKAKVDATSALDIVSRACNQLEHFVAFSSVSCGRGNPGQSNYGFANSVMERICESRRAVGLPGTAIQWGAVGDVGLVLDSMKGGNETVVGGTLPQRITSCLSTLDYFLQLQDPVLASMVLAEKGKVGQDAGQASLVNAIANILGLKDPDNCGSKSLAELGMDSLMGSEIKQTLERNYDLVLSAQEIRNLTFPALKNLSSGENQDTSSAKQNTVVYKNILPLEDIIKLETKSKIDSTKPVFFIHPIEGVVDMLNEVASHLQTTVFGLQCVKNAPLASIEQLAAYYLQHITSYQKSGPYLIVGYSFGAGVAFEIGLQLESSGQKVTLVLIDGSPSFVRSHINNYKETKGLDKDFDAFRLSYIAMLFSNQDFAQVQKEMLALDTWNSRLKRCAEIMHNFSEEEIEEGASSFGKKLNASYVYEPRFKFNGEVILLKAAESFVDLGEDYDLKKHCSQKVIVNIVPGDHKTVLVGNSAKLIAGTVNKYAEELLK